MQRMLCVGVLADQCMGATHKGSMGRAVAGGRPQIHSGGSGSSFAVPAPRSREEDGEVIKYFASIDCS